MEYLDMAKETLGMFLFLAAELTVLFLIVNYFVGILQNRLPPEKIQNALSSKSIKGYLMAVLLGAITPFCSCSTIPFLKGLLKANASFGTVITFLFASPLLNPIIIGLFFITFGWKVTLFYALVSAPVSMLAGWILEKLGFQRYVKSEDYLSNQSSCGQKKETDSHSCSAKSSNVSESCCSKEEAKSCCSKEENKSYCSKEKDKPFWKKNLESTLKDFKSFFPYMLLGVAIGALIHGFVPADFIASVSGEDNPFAVPIAAIIGVPLYVRVETVIPLSAALMAKGMGMGAIMALIIGSAGASLTEVILLKSIFKNKMILAFLFVVFSMAILAGYGYYLLF